MDRLRNKTYTFLYMTNLFEQIHLDCQDGPLEILILYFFYFFKLNNVCLTLTLILQLDMQNYELYKYN